MGLDAYVAELDARYEANVHMPWSLHTGNDYHTRLRRGTRVHQTKEAADYALALLRLGRADRAADVLDALAGLQVTDPLSEHYGIWGWFLEEPPGQMAPADWNWADFIGVRLAQVLAVHDELLDRGVRERVSAALRHAALAIFRRNADPGYTNIAVMGAVTTAAAAEILGLPFLLDFGRRRLRAVLALHDRSGGFTEYNSPAYGRVVLEELERAALIVADDGFRATAEELRRRTWAALAERFHPGTGQLAGPMSRAYHDRLQPDLAAYLAAQTGSPIKAREEGVGAPLLVPPLPCPPELAERFGALKEAPVQLRTRFTATTTGTTWLAEDACLGSADEECAWVQRRPLLGYWRTPEDPAVVLRARMLLNGHDLSAAWCRQYQDGARVLSAWWLSYDSGDVHPELDRPPGSVFHVSDLRLRVSLQGRGATVRELRDGVFALTAGARQAVVHTGPAEFLGTASTWRAREGGGAAGAEVVLYAGPSAPVDFHQARLHAAFALELIRVGRHHSTATLTASREAAGTIRWGWDGLTVSTPIDPTPFDR
ncbi:hypothetical protein [Nonomuraea sp. 10N515B]|uniref:hypothetical protein n=1 Tax=Nonomuraea sp. 10N515B TaxID=3457422 RepID=UPI003FCC4AF4